MNMNENQRKLKGKCKENERKMKGKERKREENEGNTEKNKTVEATSQGMCKRVHPSISQPPGQKSSVKKVF